MLHWKFMKVNILLSVATSLPVSGFWQWSKSWGCFCWRCNLRPSLSVNLATVVTSGVRTNSFYALLESEIAENSHAVCFRFFCDHGVQVETLSRPIPNKRQSSVKCSGTLISRGVSRGILGRCVKWHRKLYDARNIKYFLIYIYIYRAKVFNKANLHYNAHS